MSGKGSKPRPLSVSTSIFDNNWDTIFKKGKDMQVRVQENTEEIGKCGCGRSPTGKCIGWHGLTEKQYQQKLEEYQTKDLEH